MRLGVVCGMVFNALVIAAPLAASLAAQQGSPRIRGRIVGVFDEASGEPIPGAEVIDLFNGGEARTEEHGLVELSQFAERHDMSAIRIRKLGFADTSLVVRVGTADSVPLEIDLHKAAIDLPALISHATVATTLDERRLEEFESRRKMGFGSFIDGPELRRYVDNHSLANYLAGHLAGLTYLSNQGEDGAVYLSGERGGCAGPVVRCGMDGGGGCPIALYIDGVPVYVPGKTGTIPDFRDYDPSDFVAVEWYPGPATVPAEYGGNGSQCGVMLLWRRYH